MMTSCEPALPRAPPDAAHTTVHSHGGGFTYESLTRGVGPVYSIGVGPFYVVKAILLHHGLHHRAQPRKPLPHVGHPGRNPDPRPRRQRDHRTSPSSAARTQSASARPMTRTRACPRSMSIVPVTPLGFLGLGSRDPATAAVTWMGSSAGIPESTSSFPSRYSRRHWKT